MERVKLGPCQGGIHMYVTKVSAEIVLIHFKVVSNFAELCLKSLCSSFSQVRWSKS